MADSRPSVKTINALKARQQLGTLLEEVFYRDEQFIIERAGRPMAAVVPVWQLEEWQQLQDRPKPSPDPAKAGKRRRKQGNV
jgi:prevent-host-death family protein